MKIARKGDPVEGRLTKQMRRRWTLSVVHLCLGVCRRGQTLSSKQVPAMKGKGVREGDLFIFLGLVQWNMQCTCGLIWCGVVAGSLM